MSDDIKNFSYRLNLNLGQVPPVADREVYMALLQIYNAIEILADSSGQDIEALLAFLLKFRKLTEVTGDYTVLATDGTILVDDTEGDVTITLLSYKDVLGYRFDIKKISVGTGNKTVLKGHGFGVDEELIDGRVGGILISSKSSYTVKATESGWVII